MNLKAGMMTMRMKMIWMEEVVVVSPGARMLRMGKFHSVV